MAAIPYGRVNDGTRNRGWWISGSRENERLKERSIERSKEFVGISGSDTYSEGRFYPPKGQSRLYIGCTKTGKDGLVAVRYGGTQNKRGFNGCMNVGGVSIGELLLIDEPTSRTHPKIVGALCSEPTGSHFMLL